MIKTLLRMPVIHYNTIESLTEQSYRHTLVHNYLLTHSNFFPTE